MHQRVVMSLLSLAATASLAAAAGTVLVLHPEDRISLGRGAVLTALGLVFFPCLFLLTNEAVLRTAAGDKWRRKYRLTCGDVLDINNKVVSAVQALLSVVTGAVVCLYSCRRDVVRTSHYMSEAYAWFGAAYFFYDIWSMYKVHVQMSLEKHKKSPANGLAGGDARPADASVLAYVRSEPLILAHHIFIGGFGFAVITHLRGELGDCVFGFPYLMELSTPFVSLRGILSRLRRKASPAYVANGLAMLATFFLCRVISLPYACWLYSEAVNLSYIDAVRSLPLGCKVSVALLLGPQLYWFGLMARGAARVLAPPRPAAAAAAAKSS